MSFTGFVAQVILPACIPSVGWGPSQALILVGAYQSPDAPWVSCPPRVAMWRLEEGNHKKSSGKLTNIAGWKMGAPDVFRSMYFQQKHGDVIPAIAMSDYWSVHDQNLDFVFLVICYWFYRWIHHRFSPFGRKFLLHFFQASVANPSEKWKAESLSQNATIMLTMGFEKHVFSGCLSESEPEPVFRGIDKNLTSTMDVICYYIFCRSNPWRKKCEKEERSTNESKGHYFPPICGEPVWMSLSQQNASILIYNDFFWGGTWDEIADQGLF